MEMQRERAAIGSVFGNSRNRTTASGETLVEAASLFAGERRLALIPSRNLS
jgi:hypothetical protein